MRHQTDHLTRELAEQWNTRFGEFISVRLRNVETISAPTAAHAPQWGEFALVTLRGVPELWTVIALKVD